MSDATKIGSVVFPFGGSGGVGPPGPAGPAGPPGPAGPSTGGFAFFDATLAIFKLITLGGGPTALLTAAVRGSHAVLSCLNGVAQGCVWQSAMPSIYGGGDCTLSIYWVASSAAAGNVVWAAAFERDNATFDIDVDGFAAIQTAAAAATPVAAGQLVLTTIAFTNAQMDAIVAGEPFRLLVQRTGSAAGDSYAASAEIVRVVLTED